MTLPSSGNPISLNQVQTEFGGSNPIGMNEYYSSASNIPTSGAISMSDFHGKSAPTELTSGVNVQQILASTYISDGGTLTIPAGVYVWSDDTSIPALKIDVNNATIVNNGYIIGRGGNGGNETGTTSGGAGGPAIEVTGTNAFITNNSGAYIAGGGGGGGYVNNGTNDAGGGGGAGGGQGGTSNPNVAGYAGGSVGQAGGGNGLHVIGGEAGGGGGLADESSGGSNYGYGGGGGGRILPGTQTPNATSGRSGLRTIGKGGGGGQAGTNGGTSGNGARGHGGGGWGAAGGGSNGGAGGKSILLGSGASADYSNDGTVYGTSDATLMDVLQSGTVYVSNGTITAAGTALGLTWTVNNAGYWAYGATGVVATLTLPSNVIGDMEVEATITHYNSSGNAAIESGEDKAANITINSNTYVASGTYYAGWGATPASVTYNKTVLGLVGGDVMRIWNGGDRDWRNFNALGEYWSNITLTGA